MVHVPGLPKQLAHTRRDFRTTYQLFLYSQWAFCEVYMPDNGKSIAEAIQVGTCKLVSDGSFKDGMGTAVWIHHNSTTLISMTGKTKIPGEVGDQSAYRSKFWGMGVIQPCSYDPTHLSVLQDFYVLCLYCLQWFGTITAVLRQISESQPSGSSFWYDIQYPKACLGNTSVLALAPYGRPTRCIILYSQSLGHLEHPNGHGC